MKKTAQDVYPGGAADTSPGQDAVHPYSYDEEPSCSNCKKPMVLVTAPYSPSIVFNCPDCNTKTEVTGPNRVEPGTGNSESGAEHIQTFEGLLDKGAAMEKDPIMQNIEADIELLIDNGLPEEQIHQELVKNYGDYIDLDEAIQILDDYLAQHQNELPESYKTSSNEVDPTHAPYETSGRAPSNPGAQDIRMNINDRVVQHTTNTPTSSIKDSILKEIEASDGDLQSMAREVLMSDEAKQAMDVLSREDGDWTNEQVLDLLSTATAKYVSSKPEIDFIMVFEDLLNEVSMMAESEAGSRVYARLKKQAVGKDQPFTLTVRDEWTLKNEISRLVYGKTYFQLLTGQKERIDMAFRTFWDSHSTFSSMKRKLPAIVAALKVAEAGRPVWRNCKSCGEDFNTSQYKDYCSENCYEAAGRPVEEPPEPWPTETSPRRAPGAYSSMNKEAAPPRRTVEDLPEPQPRQPADSQGQRLQKRLETAASIVEDYLVTVQLIDLQIEEYRKKLAQRLKVEKLEQEAEAVEPTIKQILRALDQHEATVKGVAFRLRDASTRTSVVDKASVERILEQVRKIVQTSALPKFEKLAKDLFKESEVSESFSQNLTTEQEERIPKEVPPEAYEDVSQDQAQRLLDVRRRVRQSLNVEADFSIKDFWNKAKLFITQKILPFLGFVESAEDQLSAINKELEALGA
jgi:phage terminase small subunit